MTNPLSMFTEKQGATNAFSMTRVVALMFAVTYCFALYTYSTKAHEINWPFAMLGVITLLAVPIQAIFVFLREYIASGPGRALLGKAIEHFVPGASSTVASTVSSIITKTSATKEDA